MRASRFTGPSTAMAAKHSASPTSHRAFFHGLGRQRDYDGTFDWIPRATRPKLGMGPVVPQIGANFETWSGEHTVYVINDNNGSLFLFEQLSGETWMTRDAISKVSPNWNPGGAGAPDPRALAAITPTDVMIAGVHSWPAYSLTPSVWRAELRYIRSALCCAALPLSGLT